MAFLSVRQPGWRRALACGIVLAALALSACGGGGKAPEAVLKVASQKGGDKALMTASGALAGAPYRVEWSDFPAAQHLLEVLAAGAADIGLVGDAPFLFAWSGGADIKAVHAAASDQGGISTAIIVRKDSPIRSEAELKGRKIATGRGSIGHYLLLRLLERAHAAVAAGFGVTSRTELFGGLPFGEAAARRLPALPDVAYVQHLRANPHPTVKRLADLVREAVAEQAVAAAAA